MAEEMIWRIPGPPPAYVVSVIDDEGNEWHRCGPSGEFWRDEYGRTPWESLVIDCGPLRAGRRAA